VSDVELERIDRSPTYLSSGLALAAAAATTVASAAVELATLVCLAGLLAVAIGLAVGRQPPVTVGTGLLVLGVIVSGAAEVPVLVTLLGITAALLTYDFATTAIGLGEQLGRGAPTAQVELLHAGVSTFLGLGIVVASFVVKESAAGDQPVGAVLGLLIAVVVLVAALRRADAVFE
jgi:hypothetical protein